MPSVKSIASFFATFFIIFLMVYLVGAFIEIKLDFRKWDMADRVFVGLVGSIGGFILGAVVAEQVDLNDD